MKLFTQTEYEQLIENGKPKIHDKDHNPVGKLFVPGRGATFVLTVILSEKRLMTNILCTAGDECKLSNIDLDKVSELGARNKSQVKKANKFRAKSPVSVFLDSAKRRGSAWEIKDILNKSVH